MSKIVYFSDINDDGVIETEKSAQNPQDIEVLQRNLYYPFGMQLDGIGDYANAVTEENKYLYNNKELHNDVGLQWAEYGARFYDPSIARWGQIDPLTERGPWISSYVYAFNNPISFYDPDGRWPYPGGIALGAGYREAGKRTLRALKNIGEGFLLTAGAVTSLGDYHIAANAERLGNDKLAAELREGANNAAANLAFEIGLGFGVSKIFKGTALAFASTKGWSFGNTSKQLIKELGEDVSIIMAKGGDDLAYLNNIGADAVYITGEGGTGTIVIREGASKSALVEEALHHAQRLKYGDDYFCKNNISLEIEAQDVLIDIAKKEKWGADEISRLEAAKASWTKLQK